MKEKRTYFNRFEFEKAKSIASLNPIAGVKAYGEYLEAYPEDYYSYPYYISTLILIGNLEEAERLLNGLREKYYTEDFYKRNQEKARFQNYNIHFCTVKLLAYQNKSQELIDYYDSHYTELSNIGPEVRFYNELLLGKKYNGSRETNSYFYRQMIEYQESDFKEHIKKHMADYNGNDFNISRTFFNYDFPLDEVIEEVKKYIPSHRRLNTGFLQNAYIFKYDECGRVNNKLVDYFMVTVFNNTCNFITMCPSTNYKDYDLVDLNYLKEKKDSDDKVKVLSRIDKFNQRYKRNI